MAPHRTPDEKDLNPKRGSGGKRRHRFSKKDLEILKQSFEEDPYPDFTARDELVKQLGCCLTVIDNWFQNKRARLPDAEKKRILADRKRWEKRTQVGVDLGCTDALEPSLLGPGSPLPLEPPRVSCKENAGQCDPAVQGKKDGPSCTLEPRGETGSSPSCSFSSSLSVHPYTSELYLQRVGAGMGERPRTPPFQWHLVQSPQEATQQQWQQQQKWQQSSHDYYSPLQGQQQNGWEYFQHRPQPSNCPQQQPSQNLFLMHQHPKEVGQQVQWDQGEQLALGPQMQPLHLVVSSPPLSPTEYIQAADEEQQGKQYFQL